MARLRLAFFHLGWCHRGLGRDTGQKPGWLRHGGGWSHRHLALHLPLLLGKWERTWRWALLPVPVWGGLGRDPPDKVGPCTLSIALSSWARKLVPLTPLPPH